LVIADSERLAAAARVHQEVLQGLAAGLFTADLLVWPAEDAEDIGLADDPA
jgi:hypothetical protein